MMTIMIHDTTGRRWSAQSRVRRGAESGLPTACLSTWKRKVVYHASPTRCVTGIRKLLSHPIYEESMHEQIMRVSQAGARTSVHALPQGPARDRLRALPFAAALT